MCVCVCVCARVCVCVRVSVCVCLCVSSKIGNEKPMTLTKREENNDQHRWNFLETLILPLWRNLSIKKDLCTISLHSPCTRHALSTWIKWVWDVQTQGLLGEFSTLRNHHFFLPSPGGLRGWVRRGSKGREVMTQEIYGRSRVMESLYVLGYKREGLAKDKCDSQSSEGEVKGEEGPLRRHRKGKKSLKWQLIFLW